jgi:hypothetical protein
MSGGESASVAAAEAFTAEMALAEAAAAVKVLLAPPNEAELLGSVRRTRHVTSSFHSIELHRNWSRLLFRILLSIRMAV